MHWLLFIHKILISSTCFEPQVLIFRRIQLYTSSIWYCHSLWEFLVACRYTGLLFIHKILIYSTCLEPQVLIFRRIQLYTSSIWYCHSLWEFLVACRYTGFLFIRKILIYSTCSSLKCSSSGGYSCTNAAYGTVTLYESSWWLVGTQLEWVFTQAVYRQATRNCDSTICCMCTTISSWRWALETRNM